MACAILHPWVRFSDLKSHPTISCDENLELHERLWRLQWLLLNLRPRDYPETRPTDFYVCEYLVHTCTSAQTR